jgi:hypothetical protein
MVVRMLELIKWLRCTKGEAKHWEDVGYDIFTAAGWKTSLKDTPLFDDQPDPNAFATHFDEFAKAERALKATGIEATKDEGLMKGELSYFALASES